VPVITISRGSYSKGREVAERVARKLGYGIVSRDIVLEASEEFNIPEIKLIRAIHDAPSILDRLSHKKEKYIAYIRAALLQHFCKDNIVYHGLAGQFFVGDISHVLKVRIISDMKERVRAEMDREGVSEAEAQRLLRRDDEERRKWSEHLYGIDARDPSLYDLVIHIHKLTVEEAADAICDTAGFERFQATPESERAMEDLGLSAAIEAALHDIGYTVQVIAMNGSVSVKAGAALPHQFSRADDIRNTVKGIPGVKDIHVDIEPVLPISE